MKTLLAALGGVAVLALTGCDTTTTVVHKYEGPAQMGRGLCCPKYLCVQPSDRPYGRGLGRGMGRGYGPGCRYWQAPQPQETPKPDVKPMPPAKDKPLPPWCRLNQQPPKK